MWTRRRWGSEEDWVSSDAAYGILFVLFLLIPVFQMAVDFIFDVWAAFRERPVPVTLASAVALYGLVLVVQAVTVNAGE